MPDTHDMGGLPAGPLNLDDADPTVFDKRVDALYALLTGHRKQIFTMDEVRRTVESFTEAEYLRLSYYERWLRAIALLMVERGLASHDELFGPERP